MNPKKIDSFSYKDCAVPRLRVLFVALSCCAALAACGESCDYAVLSEVMSPDQKLKAVVFQRGCGTDIDSSTQVSILSSQALPRDRGNAFIIGDDRHEALSDKKPSKKIEVVWESNSSLAISYTKNAQVTLKEVSFAGVAIKYDVLP